MKIKARKIDGVDKPGSVMLIAESQEDMWNVYNLLGFAVDSGGEETRASAECRITGVTFRKVVKESESGSASSEKKKVKLTISMEKVDFDVDASSIRVSGKNLEENEHVKLGQFHTLELDLNRPFTLWKSQWDSIDLDRLNNSVEASQAAEIICVLLDVGRCEIVAISSELTLTLSKVEVNIPRKRQGQQSSEYEKALARFYQLAINSMVQRIDFSEIKCILIASSGYLRLEFIEVFDSKIKQMEDSMRKLLLENRHKLMPVAVTSSHRQQALKEIMSDPAVLSRIEATKFAKEIGAMDEFFKTFRENPEKAFYSYKQVLYAAEASAVEKLLLVDSLFRSSSIKERRKYIDLVDLVKSCGGSTFILSSMHSSGERTSLFFNLDNFLHG